MEKTLRKPSALWSENFIRTVFWPPQKVVQLSVSDTPPSPPCFFFPLERSIKNFRQKKKKFINVTDHKCVFKIPSTWEHQIGEISNKWTWHEKNFFFMDVVLWVWWWWCWWCCWCCGGGKSSHLLGKHTRIVTKFQDPTQIKRRWWLNYSFVHINQHQNPNRTQIGVKSLKKTSKQTMTNW